MTTGHPRTNRRAVIERACLLVVSVLVTLELVSNLYYSSIEGGLFYVRSSPETGRPASVDGPRLQLDPYFGFSRMEGTSVQQIVEGTTSLQDILREEYGNEPPPAWLGTETNNYGFFSDEDYPTQSSDDFVIALFGGSVAERFFLQGKERLVARLSEGNPSVRLLCFAHSAFKQPQQLLVLSYFLSLGQQFDLIVNLDGVNEAGMGLGNEENNVAFFAPWHSYMNGLAMFASGTAEEEAKFYVARMTLLEADIVRLEERRRQAMFATQFLLTDLRLKARQSAYRELAATSSKPGSSVMQELVRMVPGQTPGDVEQSIALHWARSSAIMNVLAREAGAHYIHVLQPNQYYGQRVFSERESRRALSPKSPFRHSVIRVYPLLLEHGEKLASDGVDFVNATAVFNGVTDPVYSDDCCHLTRRGNEVLADFLAERILPWLPNR